MDMNEPNPAGLVALRAPVARNLVSYLPKPYKKDSPKGNCKECGGYHGLPAMHLEYVGHAAITNMLLDADPGWSWEPVALGADGLPVVDSEGGLWIRLTICGVTRLGYGDAGGKTGTNAMKERIGDALRNAAMRFGAALELWHKGELHVESVDTDTGEITQRPTIAAPQSKSAPAEVHAEAEPAKSAPEKPVASVPAPPGQIKLIISKLKGLAAIEEKDVPDVTEECFSAFKLKTFDGITVELGNEILKWINERS